MADNKKYKIANIRKRKRSPVVYADLQDAETGVTFIAADLPYIFKAIEERKMNCVNISKDRSGKIHIKL